MCGKALQSLPFVVYLSEKQEGGMAKEHTTFECQAIDADHAEDQATAAYPGCRIIFSFHDVGAPEVVDIAEVVE